MDITGMVILLIGVVALVLLGLMYNRMVRNKNRVHEAWSAIDVFLRKRYELVPNIVELVKAYAGYEKKLIEELSSLRAEAMNRGGTTERLSSEAGLSQSLSHLFIVVEGYPELKADANFLQLQHQITEIEVELERARRYYNGTVREYNTCLQRFPANLFAGLFGFHAAAFFVIKPGEEQLHTFTF